MSTRSAAQISSICLAKTCRFSNRLRTGLCSSSASWLLHTPIPSLCFNPIMLLTTCLSIDSRLPFGTTVFNSANIFRSHPLFPLGISRYQMSRRLDVASTALYSSFLGSWRCKGLYGPVKWCLGSTKPFFDLNGIFPITLWISRHVIQNGLKCLSAR